MIFFESLRIRKMQKMILLFSSFIHCISKMCMLIIIFSSQNSFTNEDDYIWYGYKYVPFRNMMLFKHNIVYLTSIFYYQDPYLRFHQYSCNGIISLFLTCQVLQLSIPCVFAIFILTRFSLLRKALIKMPCFYFSIMGSKGFAWNMAEDAYYIVFLLEL